MEKELVIKNTSSGYEIALLENKKLVEIHFEKIENAFNVGDVFLGRVRKTMPGMNAAFIDVGYEKDGFLHYTDLGPKFKTFQFFYKGIQLGKIHSINQVKYQPEIDKKGNIADVMKASALMPVQIFKEAISSKGPRLTTEISIAGRYLILTPFDETIGISKKIRSEKEKDRLKRLIKSLVPKNFGVIVRTVAQNKGAAELHKDLNNLISKWELMLHNLKGAKPKQKLLSELDKSSAIVRDLLNENFTSITTDDEILAEELEKYIEGVDSNKKDIVKIHKGKTPIFDAYDITKQIKSSFGTTVNFGRGPYLVIDHTEAMHVIDVNSGHKTGLKGDQESNALNVNLEAVEEISRQLRLRDIGGIIVIDFIDMRKAENRKEVYSKMKELLKKDKATTHVLPLSKFNLMQITRQRVRPQIEITTKETCPTCHGTGKVEATLLLMDSINNDVEYYIANGSVVTLNVHPYIEAYIKKGFPSKQLQWFIKHKKWIKVNSDEDLALTNYKVLNKNNEELGSSQSK